MADMGVFKSKQAGEIIRWVRAEHGDELEFLWRRFPKNAIWRNKINRKWYAALLVVSNAKLSLNSEEEVEIIDLRFNKHEALDFAEGNEHIYPGYHMNKNNWITIILDGSVPTAQILDLVEHSYELSLKA